MQFWYSTEQVLIASAASRCHSMQHLVIRGCLRVSAVPRYVVAGELRGIVNIVNAREQGSTGSRW
jgi:hypothetical protein